MKEYEEKCYYCDNIVDKRGHFSQVLLETTKEDTPFRWKRIGVMCDKCTFTNYEVVSRKD